MYEYVSLAYVCVYVWEGDCAVIYILVIRSMCVRVC